MRMVLLDTVGLLALWDVDDQWHAGAEHAMIQVSAAAARLVSTSAILLECGNAASRRPYRSDVAQLRRDLILDSRLVVPTESDVDQAWAAYRRGSAGDAGIVDHISFIVMRRLGIKGAFTNDKHFQIAGFNTLF